MNKKISPREKALQNQIEALQKQIEERTEYYENILSLMPGHVYWLDKNNTYLGCNNEQAKDAGLSSRLDIVNKTNAELPWHDQAEKLDKINREVMMTGERQTATEFAEMVDGEKIFFSQKVPLKNKKNEIIGLLGISVDITELTKTQEQLARAKEEAEAANLAKDVFIRNMSHDIRTPLSGIIGISSILEQEAHTHEEKENAHMINVSGEQLLSLLNSVLDMIATGSQKENQMNQSIFSPQELIQAVAELEQPTITYKNLELRLNLDTNLPQHIKSDQIKIHRILLNLLGNAVKFTETGYIEIGAAMSGKLRKDKQRIVFYIKDTGPGINPEDQNKIFNKFFRGTASYQGIYSGHGVGLHIVKRYTKLLNGTIQLESTPGKGTTFSVSIPVKVVTESAPLPSKHQESSAKPDVNDEKIPAIKVLLIEDNPAALKMAEKLLERMGLMFKSAKNGAKAIELFKKESFDLVLSDLGLPDQSGTDVARQLRHFEKSSKKTPVPIIGLSAHSLHDIDSECIAAGMNQMLTKPIRQTMIQELLNQYQINKTISINPKTSHTTPAHSDESANLPLLDEALAVSYLGSKEDVGELINIMLNESMVETIKMISQHFETESWEEFKKAVHKFKSSCMYCATTKLLHHTKTLESLADSQDNDSIRQEYERFMSCVELTREHLQNWLAQEK